MDFHCLLRKDLQALCKKNKIPANMTNVAMADALQALQQVEGLEAILNPVESDCHQVKVGMRSAPRTATRTSTRQKPGKIVLGSSEEIFNDANSTMTPAVPTTRRRAPAASARKKLEIENEDDERNECKISNVFETPGVQSCRRRGTGRTLTKKMETPYEENSLQKACSYSTRRSMRLLEKRIADLSLGQTEHEESTKWSEISVDAIDVPKISNETEEINKVLSLGTESATFSERCDGSDVSIENKTSDELDSKMSDSKLDLGYPDGSEVTKSSDEPDIPEKEVDVSNETADNDNNVGYHPSSEQVSTKLSSSDDCDAPGGESNVPVMKNGHEMMVEEKEKMECFKICFQPEAQPTDILLSSKKTDLEVEPEITELTEESKDEVVTVASDNQDTLTGTSLDVQVESTNEDLLGYQLPIPFPSPTVLTTPKKNVGEKLAEGFIDDEEDVGEAESKDTVKENVNCNELEKHVERIFCGEEDVGEAESKDTVKENVNCNELEKHVERSFGGEEDDGEAENKVSVKEYMISNGSEQQIEIGDKEDDGEVESKRDSLKENLICNEHAQQVERNFGDDESECKRDSVKEEDMVLNELKQQQVQKNISGDGGASKMDSVKEEDMVLNELKQQQVQKNIGGDEGASKMDSVKENIICNEFGKLTMGGLKREIKRLERIIQTKSKTQIGDIKMEEKRIALLPLEGNRRPVVEEHNENRDV